MTGSSLTLSKYHHANGRKGESGGIAGLRIMEIYAERSSRLWPAALAAKTAPFNSIRSPAPAPGARLAAMKTGVEGARGPGWMGQKPDTFRFFQRENTMHATITTLGVVSTLIQLGVAVYALRLTRVFGTRRVGWSLFAAFFLMALLHTIEAAASGFFLEDNALLGEAVFLFISILLLAGLIHIKRLTREILRSEETERRLRAGLEIELQRRTEYLLKSLEGLQAEMDERRRIEQAIDQLKSNWPAAARATGPMADFNSVRLS